jgi:predicted nucleic acid-binding protein
LNHLVLIDEVDLLPALFGEVVIPQAVFQELKQLKTTAKVQHWISHFLAWLEVRTVASVPSPALIKLGCRRTRGHLIGTRAWNQYRPSR